MKIKEINQHNTFSIIIIILLILGDIFCYYFSYYMVLNILNIPSIIDFPILIIIGILFLFRFFGRYNPSSLESRLKELKIIISLTSITTFVYLIYKIIFNYITIQQSQNIILLSLLFLLTVLIVRVSLRTVQKQLLKLNIGLRNTIIIGEGKNGLKFINKIDSNDYSGFKILGYFDSVINDDIKIFLSKNKNYFFKNCHIGTINEVKDFIKKNNIKEVIIALNQKKEHQSLLNLISELRNLDVCIKIVPDIYDLLTGYAQMHTVTGMPLIDINPDILTELQFVIKRSLDIIVSIIGLIISFPVLLIVSILIKLSSKGPIIFKQERVGLNGKPFIVHKFRTMYQNSELKSGPVWAKVDDPRITKVGNFIRKTRIDEFPQFYDVLIGNMSIVGPRPERVFFINKLKNKFPYYLRRLNVRPGVTGWAQIMGSYDTDIDGVENKLKLDFYYIENISIWLDIKIMIITFWVIISRKGQ